MEKIGGPLRNLLERLQLAQPMDGWRAVELWPDVAGEKVAARAEAVAFREGVLVLRVESPAWMSELTYLKRKFINELNRRLGAEVVKDIQLRPAGGPEGSGPRPKGDR